MVIDRFESPLVSIGVPVYNGEFVLPVLLESLVAQSYHSLEIIISDNASTDRTREISESFCRRDSRVRYISNDKNIGAIGNFNKVASEATGEYFMWAAADDLFHPFYIESCLEELQKDSELFLVGSRTSQYVGAPENSLFVDPGVTLLENDPGVRYLKYRDILLAPEHIGMIFYGLHRKAELDKVLPLLEMIGSDHLHVGSLALHGKIKTIDKVLSWKKFGGASRSYREIVKTFNNRSANSERIIFFAREIGLQKQIWQYSGNTFRRIQLSILSFYHFVKNNILLRSRKGQRMKVLKNIGLKKLILIFLYFTWYQRKPWSRGYYPYKAYFLERTVNDPVMMSRFINKEELPPRFGYRIDERAVEYLWVFSRLKLADKNILDAGSSLNFPFLLDSRSLKDRIVTLCTLAPEVQHYKDARVSYIYNDLRDLILKDECFDVVNCISTLEHVGMDNTLLYTDDDQHKESSLKDYLDVVRELKRVLKPGGKLLITVPFGKYENHGWQQQFDARMVEDVIDAFGCAWCEVEYFRYADDGWARVEQESCCNDSYFDFHSVAAFTDDMLAAARSIACIELVK